MPTSPRNSPMSRVMRGASPRSTRLRKNMPAKNILVIDVGGTHVKVGASNQKDVVKIDSGATMTPAMMVTAVKKAIAGWKFDAVAIGYPGPVLHGRAVAEPHNLGCGWIGFDFQKALGKPVKLLNDA